MIDAYRSPAGRAEVVSFCEAALRGWTLEHTTRTLAVRPSSGTLVETGAARVLPRGADGPIDTHVVVVGDPHAAPRVVLVPDAGFTAAVLESAAASLAHLGPLWILDAPGHPGLSSPLRPRRGSAPWYAAWLDAVLDAADARDVLLVGIAAGSIPVLGARHGAVTGRLLVAPAGIVSYRTGPRMARDTARWLMRATPATSLAVARHLVAGQPGKGLVEWLTLVGRSCRSQGAPKPLARPELDRALEVPARIAVGSDDCYLPATALAAELVRRDDAALDVDVIPGAGHVLGAEHWGRVAWLAHELRAAAGA